MVRCLELQKKPAFLCDSCKSRAKGPSLYHVTKTAKLPKQRDFYKVRIAVSH